MRKKLSKDFYQREDVPVIARELLGKVPEELEAADRAGEVVLLP
jgi:hypothetical protein